MIKVSINIWLVQILCLPLHRVKQKHKQTSSRADGKTAFHMLEHHKDSGFFVSLQTFMLRINIY